METTQPSEKQCKNCKNFVMYYTNRSGTFRTLMCGHCMLDSRKKRRLYNNFCDLWESDEAQLNDRRKNFENALYKMAQNLDRYLQILEQEKRE